ncbi:hypothetical protein AB4Z48_01045 [Cupriavidus sp. 2TAF22]|uniref:hypothetical protein n=1 Tax=unclassified Cupriavidus TaxID=2640874 RepID=UPI003F8FF566
MKQQARQLRATRVAMGFAAALWLAPPPQAQPVESGPMTVGGSLVVEGPLTVHGSLTADGGVLAHGPLSAAWFATRPPVYALPPGARPQRVFHGPLTVHGPLVVQGNVLVNGPLNVDGPISASGGIEADGPMRERRGGR